MEALAEKIQALLFYQLITNCPVLSGNMQLGIEQGFSGLDTAEIIISAPFYDTSEWNKHHRVVHTGKVVKGKTDYAMWVNRDGAFGKHNQSEGWVNRAVLEAVTAIANEIGAEVINKL